MMSNNSIKASNLVIAEVKFFDKERNGIEYCDAVSHVVLLRRGNSFFNVLNPGEAEPVFKRAMCTTNVVVENGAEYGTMVSLVEGEERTGEVWLLTNRTFDSLLGKDEVTLREVEDYVISSDDFFHNREQIVLDRMKRERCGVRTKRNFADILINDAAKRYNMRKFFGERVPGKVYIK